MTFNFVTVLMLCNALFVNGKGLPQTEKDRIDTADLLKQLQEPEDDYFPGKSENRLPHEMFLEDSSDAQGITVYCRQNDMSITIPKPILKGVDKEHLRLLDPSCKATETPMYFSLQTPLTGCKSSRRSSKSAIVYSNTVLEIPLKNSDIITRIREIEIPFSCYYSNSEIAAAVGFKPKSRKLVFLEKGKGNFTVLLEFYHSKRYIKPYGPKDFPIPYKLRQQMYLQGKVDSKDKRLSIMFENCVAIPTPDEKNAVGLQILTNGCAVDDTVQFHPAPTGYSRFSMEAFQFVKHPFVFIHCHVVICDASDSQSRCARGCVPSPRRERRGIEEKRVYSLVQGPLTIDDSSEEFEPSNDETAQNPPEIEVEVNMPIVATVAAATAFTVFGVVFVALRSRPHQN